MPERLAEMLLDLWTPLIILWITVPPCIHTAPMNQSQVLMSGSRLELNRLSEEQRVLNRSKRGWVWNQMFVLEEFSGPEPILVGRVSFVFFFFFKISISGSVSCLQILTSDLSQLLPHFAVSTFGQMVGQFTYWFLQEYEKSRGNTFKCRQTALLRKAHLPHPFHHHKYSNTGVMHTQISVSFSSFCTRNLYAKPFLSKLMVHFFSFWIYTALIPKMLLYLETMFL